MTRDKSLAALAAIALTLVCFQQLAFVPPAYAVLMAQVA